MEIEAKQLLDRLKNFIDLEFNGSRASFAKWIEMPPSTVRAMFLQETWPPVKLFMLMKEKDNTIDLGYFLHNHESYRLDPSGNEEIEKLPDEEKMEVWKARYIQGQDALLKIITAKS